MPLLMFHLCCMIELWTFIHLVLFFNTFNWCFQDASAWVTEGLALTGQDASAWVTESLTLTECEFLPKTIALYFR